MVDLILETDLVTPGATARAACPSASPRHPVPDARAPQVPTTLTAGLAGVRLDTSATTIGSGVSAHRLVQDDHLDRAAIRPGLPHLGRILGDATRSDPVAATARRRPGGEAGPATVRARAVHHRLSSRSITTQ